MLDALNATSVASVVARHEIDTIFNLVALLSAVGERNPQMAWHVNIGALDELGSRWRASTIARLFTPSSIGAFGPSSPKVRTPQDTVMQPTTIYGICKVTRDAGATTTTTNTASIPVRSVFRASFRTSRCRAAVRPTMPWEIYYEAIRSGRYTCAVPHDVYMDMIYMPDVLRACVELMEADPARLRHRNSFNIASMSFTPGHHRCRDPQAHPLVHDGLQHRSRQGGDRPGSWPDSLDDTCAREEWGWRPEWDLSRMTDDMLAAIRSATAASPPRLTYDPRRQRRRRRRVLDGNFSISRVQSRARPGHAEAGEKKHERERFSGRSRFGIAVTTIFICCKTLKPLIPFGPWTQST
ncbi:NAD-dependent epimerase/dehydratase family protein [Alistipes putredinis]|uniref:NAD-dependent epimerase/dehydratase family protein n=1 Tax=Alistipes putredinis TaxID=28117 RepID=UPI0039959DB2